MMGEACYAAINITRRKCVKRLYFQLRIELNDASIQFGLRLVSLRTKALKSKTGQSIIFSIELMLASVF